jgi:hypothetical protein
VVLRCPSVPLARQKPKRSNEVFGASESFTRHTFQPQDETPDPLVAFFAGRFHSSEILPQLPYVLETSIQNDRA